MSEERPGTDARRAGSAQRNPVAPADSDEGTKTVISELNAFLKGQYMGIHAYETYIAKAQGTEMKKAFQTIQQDHIRNAARVTKRIQDLGGEAVNDEGLVGSIQQTMAKFMISDDPKDLVKGAIFAEGHFGIELSSEIVKGDLDAESKTLIEDIIAQDHQHINLLNGLAHPEAQRMH